MSTFQNPDGHLKPIFSLIPSVSRGIGCLLQLSEGPKCTDHTSEKAQIELDPS